MIGDIFDLLDLSDTEWQERAVCASVDPWIFFPHEGATPYAALRICNTVCPVRQECLESALAWEGRPGGNPARDAHGVWGGTTPRQRRKILRERGLDENEGSAA